MLKVSKNLIRLVLTGLGVIGIPVTSYLSVKCHENAKETDDKKEKVKCYVPAIASGVATAACVIGSHKVSSSQIAALSATASFAIANRDKLEEQIKKQLPDKEAKKEIAKAKIDALNHLDKEVSKDITVYNKQCIEATGYGMLKCLEGYSGRLFYSTMEKVLEAEEKMNHLYNEGEYVCMNDFYKFLNIIETHHGNQWGWVPDERYFPEFQNSNNPLGFHNKMGQDEDGNDMLIIEIMTYPMEDWIQV